MDPTELQGSTAIRISKGDKKGKKKIERYLLQKLRLENILKRRKWLQMPNCPPER